VAKAKFTKKKTKKGKDYTHVELQGEGPDSRYEPTPKDTWATRSMGKSIPDVMKSAKRKKK